MPVHLPKVALLSRLFVVYHKREEFGLFRVNPLSVLYDISTKDARHTTFIM